MKCKGETALGGRGARENGAEVDEADNRGYAVATHDRQRESGRERGFCITRAR